MRRLPPIYTFTDTLLPYPSHSNQTLQNCAESIFRDALRERETEFLRGKTMALRIFKSIFGSPAAITPDPLLGAVLVVRRALGVEKKPLDMQRLLYIAQVEHIGQFAAPIFPDIFNATSLGPIIPRLMPLLKRKKAIADPIHETILSQPMMMTLNRIAGEYGHLTSAQFVAVTHDDIGAWANYYTPGACRSIYTGRSIPIEDRKSTRLNSSH